MQKIVKKSVAMVTYTNDLAPYESDDSYRNLYLHPRVIEVATPKIYKMMRKRFDRVRLLMVMRGLDFDVYDVAYIDEREMIAKKTRDGNVIWWEMEKEGSGFTHLFKGAIKRVCLQDVGKT